MRGLENFIICNDNKDELFVGMIKTLDENYIE